MRFSGEPGGELAQSSKSRGLYLDLDETCQMMRPFAVRIRQKNPRRGAGTRENAHLLRAGSKTPGYDRSIFMPRECGMRSQPAAIGCRPGLGKVTRIGATSFARPKPCMSSAITTLYIEHIGELRRFLVRRLPCIEVAAELAHETFVRYLVAAPCAPLVNPRAFLYRIAGNLAIDYLRSHRLSSQQTVDLDGCSELPCDELSPERYVIARQQLDCLR